MAGTDRHPAQSHARNRTHHMHDAHSVWLAEGRYFTFRGLNELDGDHEVNEMTQGLSHLGGNLLCISF
ncbi:MAG: hypothetical protein GY745_17550 [Actinomycetia bacterium]|nr:hypothetical protein [Actinomycetes bacterium]